MPNAENQPDQTPPAKPRQNRDEDNAFMFPLQGLAAWVFPGAGHFLHGQRTRGGVLMVAIFLLWLWGWLIGGVTAFDRREHPYWFCCQAMTAPSFGVSLLLDLRQPRDYEGNRNYTGKPPAPSPDAPYEPSYGRANELGILFTSLAGLLNVLAIVDAGLYSRRNQVATIAPSADGPESPTPAKTLRWSILWPRLATAGVLIIGVGLALPLRLFASSSHEPVLLAYRPFIDPMPWNDSYWMLTIVPLSLAVAVVYRSVRTDDLSEMPRQAVIFTAQIVGAMVVVAGIVWALTIWL